MSKSTARAEMLPNLEIQPADALIDAPVSIRLTGLLAEQQVTLCAEMESYLGCTWASEATFVADPSPEPISSLMRWVFFGR